VEVAKLTYRPNFGDAFYGILYGFWGTPRRVLISLLMALVFGASLAFGLGAARMPLQVTVMFALAAAIAWSVLFTFAFGAVMAAYIVKIQRRKGDTQIVVTDDWIERVSGGMSLRLQWTDVSRINETRHAFFMFDAKRPVFAIEKSAVTSESTLSALRKFLRTKKPGRYVSDDTTA